MSLSVRRPVLVVALTAFVLVGTPVGAGETVDGLREEREQKRRDAADVAAELDALSAEDQELVDALEALDAHIALQESKVADAEASIAAAETRAAAARSEVDELADQMDAIRDRLQQVAIDAYVAPRLDVVEQLNSDNLLTVALRQSFLDELTGDEFDIIDELRSAEADQEAARRVAADSAAAAEDERSLLQGRLRELEASRVEAEELRAEVQLRVADWQAVGREIDEADAAIATEIRRLEEALAREAADAAARAAAEEAARVAAEEALRAAEEAANQENAEENGEQSAEDDDAETEPVSLGNFTLTHRPVPGSITSVFGPRIHPIFGTQRSHYGVDLDGSTGDPIVAAASGTVLSAAWMSGYGNTVVISHGDGFTTLYAHQTSFSASAGDEVSGGDVIGQVGSTGWSTGPHLHFEIRVEGIAVDPAPYL